MAFVDTHLHLEELGDPGPVVDQAVAAGVSRMITMGVDLERSGTAVSLANRHAEVWAAVGHYPLEQSRFDLSGIRRLAASSRVVAIGEIGLDFLETDGPTRAAQIELLDALLGLATELDLPASIHNRGADLEVEAALKNHPRLRGVMHYFALDWEWAERFLELGLHLSFAGLVTRPSRSALREVVTRCPAERLLLETDSPHGNAHKRMKEPNRPAYLLDTAELVAELRGISLDELGALETANALRLFGRMA